MNKMKFNVETVMKELAFLGSNDIYITPEKMKILAERTSRFSAKNPVGIMPVTKKMALTAIKELMSINDEAERFHYIDKAAEAPTDSIYYAVGVFLANFDQRAFFETDVYRFMEW